MEPVAIVALLLPYQVTSPTVVVPVARFTPSAVHPASDASKTVVAVAIALPANNAAATKEKSLIFFMVVEFFSVLFIIVVLFVTVVLFAMV
ncbi:MAG: hypothetical protein ACI4BD_06805 [Paludibacteraceae bacterium]